MPKTEPPQRIDDLSTSWTLVIGAHDQAATPEQRREALEKLIDRYLPLVRRYLAGALRTEPNCEVTIDDLTQQFGLRVARGSLKSADPARGQFRYFLKRILSNLIKDHKRKTQKLPVQLPESEVAKEDSSFDDEHYNREWRQELMTKALETMVRLEQESSRRLYTVLKLKLDEPELKAADLADQLKKRFGDKVDAGWVRKRLYEARKKLEELIRKEVRQTLREPTDEAVDAELAELGLLIPGRKSGRKP
jgi:RNA polymerase sigma factor (sigma-70 family)